MYAVRCKNLLVLPCTNICNSRLRPFSGLCMVIMVDIPMDLLKGELGGGMGGSAIGSLVGSFERCSYYEHTLISCFFKLLPLF